MTEARTKDLEAVRAELLKVELRPYAHHTQMVDIPINPSIHTGMGELTHRPSVFTSIYAKSGLGGESNEAIVVGSGEGATLPYPLFTDDCAENITTNTVQIINEIIDSRALKLSEHAATINAFQFPDKGRFPTARFAVEMALIDVAARTLNLSVSEAIGAHDVASVSYGKSIGSNSVRELRDQAEEAIGKGATKLKCKVTPETTDQVVNLIKTVSAHHPEIMLMVDANGSYNPSNQEHLALLNRLDGLDLELIEEPVSRVGPNLGYTAIKVLLETSAITETAICLDDCLTSKEVTVEAIMDTSAQAINIKPARIGSFLDSLTLIDLAAESGVEVMIGGMLEATPGRSANVALAAYCKQADFTIPGDISLPEERLELDLTAERTLFLNEKDEIVVPQGIGWGFKV